MKVVIVGDNNSGKEIIIEKYVRKWREENYKLTYGAVLAFSEIHVNEQIVKFHFLQLAEKEENRMPLNLFYHGALGGIIIFDVTIPETFANLEDWSKEIWENNGKGVIPLVIFGINTENRDQSPNSVTKEEGMKMASRISKKAKKEGYEIPYYEISTKVRKDIETGLEFLARAYLTVLDTLNT